MSEDWCSSLSREIRLPKAGAIGGIRAVRFASAGDPRLRAPFADALEAAHEKGITIET